MNTYRKAQKFYDTFVKYADSYADAGQHDVAAKMELAADAFFELAREINELETKVNIGKRTLDEVTEILGGR